MHAVFIPYGKRSEVELLLRDMEAQKHYLLMKKGKRRIKILIQGQVRFLPFGIYEYVFPKEDMDAVLNTLTFNNERYLYGKIKKEFLRQLAGCEKIPAYDTKNKYPWIRDNVNIIPLGIREDLEITDDKGEYKGWTHEAI